MRWVLFVLNCAHARRRKFRKSLQQRWSNGRIRKKNYKTLFPFFPCKIIFCLPKMILWKYGNDHFVQLLPQRKLQAGADDNDVQQMRKPHFLLPHPTCSDLPKHIKYPSPVSNCKFSSYKFGMHFLKILWCLCISKWKISILIWYLICSRYCTCRGRSDYARHTKWRTMSIDYDDNFISGVDC